MSEWISVNDRLPDDIQPVFIYSKRGIEPGFTYVRMLTPERVWFNNNGIRLNPTHWMPLPEPPKEESK